MQHQGMLWQVPVLPSESDKQKPQVGGRRACGEPSRSALQDKASASLLIPF